MESKEYFRWERFFTDLIESKTSDNPVMTYQKKKLDLLRK